MNRYCMMEPVWAQSEFIDAKLSEYSSACPPEDCKIDSLSSDTAIVCIGCVVNFTAVGKCLQHVQWTATGGDPGTGTGETFATRWDSVGVKTVQAVCGSSSSTPKSIQVTVVAMDSIIVDGSNPEDTGPVDVIVGITVAVRATRNPPPKDGPWPSDMPIPKMLQTNHIFISSGRSPDP